MHRPYTKLLQGSFRLEIAFLYKDSNLYPSLFYPFVLHKKGNNFQVIVLENLLKNYENVQLLPSFLHHDQRRDIAVYKRSEEHTSELQSRGHLVCRLLLEKKKQ